MKIKDIMMGTPYYCRPETNLGAATELMWKGNCGFLPVVGNDGRVRGVITDRDICIALGTRNQLAGQVTVGEVASYRLFSCSPEDDIHLALQTMKEARVRRLPVLAKDGTLVGVISVDDVLVHAEPMSLGKEPELSTDEVVRSFRSINQRNLPEVARKQMAAV
jgi:CBS domain-containing protein